MADTHSVSSSSHSASESPVDLNHELSQGFAHRFIRFKTRQLIGLCGFTQTDRVDLDQELKLRLCERFSKFDPARSDWPAFVTTVVDRQIATILESRRRLKRVADNNPVSLATPATDDDGQAVELADTITAEHQQAVTREFTRGDQELAELQLDVDTLLSELSPTERRICEELKRGNISQVARRLQIPRTTVSSLAGRLRSLCRERRIHDFL